MSFLKTKSGFKLMFVIGLSLVVSQLMEMGVLEVHSSLSPETLANNVHLGFGTSIIGLMLAALGLGMLVAVPSIAMFIVAGGSYVFGFVIYSVMEVELLRYAWPITGIGALGVWMLVAIGGRIDDEALEQSLQPLPVLPRRNLDASLFRRRST